MAVLFHTVKQPFAAVPAIPEGLVNGGGSAVDAALDYTITVAQQRSKTSSPPGIFIKTCSCRRVISPGIGITKTNNSKLLVSHCSHPF